MRLVVGAVVLGALSCGGTTTAPDAAADSSVDATVEDASEDVVADAIVDGERPLEDAGLFLCVDCWCDGRTSYCRGLYHPMHAPIVGDAGDADVEPGPCVPNNPTSGCFPYPDACAPAPSCSCLLAQQFTGCECGEVDGGAGYDVSCYVP